MTFLYLNSDKMGDGDSQLGKKLMKSFLRELAHSTINIDMVGCVNSGINLTCEGSDVLEILQEIEDDGAIIATCETCLEHYNLKDKLRIGVEGSMNKTVEIMANADQIIRPN